MSLDEEYPKCHRDLSQQLRNLLDNDPTLSAAEREDLVMSLNGMADLARDLDDIMSRMLEPGRRVKEIGELLIAFQLTTEHIRTASALLEDRLFEVGDRLKSVKAKRPPKQRTSTGKV